MRDLALLYKKDLAVHGHKAVAEGNRCTLHVIAAQIKEPHKVIQSALHIHLCTKLLHFLTEPAQLGRRTLSAVFLTQYKGRV